jgi:apolipoprotein N-acyltransferase
VLIGAALIFGWRRGGAVALVGLALLWGGGALRLQAAPGRDAVQPGVSLRLVQPAIPQSLKWDRAHLQSNFQKYLAMSQPAPGETPSAIIWGEAATGYPIEEVEPWRMAMAKLAPPDGVIVTGTNRYLRNSDNQVIQAWNGMVAFDAEGSLRGAFDKFHLVPFGEYVPLKDLLPLQIISQGASGYSPGPGPRTLRLPGLPPVAPLICYEVIFPGAVVDRADRPAWLLNLTNDGWYGVSTGPYQHLAATILRAVEEGLPLVRVANTGVSALIDGNGRVWNSLSLNQEMALTVPLPLPLNPPPYARFGDLVTLLTVTFLILALALQRLRPIL